jgi:periplasmic divalent cation tolerance protein
MLLIGWTTVGEQAQAVKLAETLVEERLAACVQIEGPITSYYTWQNTLTKSLEFRLLVKFLPHQATALEKRIIAEHPYDTPEWVVISAHYVSEKYLSWAQQSSTSDPL